jgi:hypothetical protein
MHTTLLPARMVFLILCLMITGTPLSAQSDNHRLLGTFTISAGDHDRQNTPIRFVCEPIDIFGNPDPVRRPGHHTYIGDVADLALLRDHHLALIELATGTRIPVQWAIDTDFGWENVSDKGALIFLLTGKTPANTSRTFELRLEPGAIERGPFSIDDIENTHLLLQRNGKPVLRYNYDIVREKPGQTSVQDRSSYIHPVWTPKGQVVTGDFSPEHPHQRGIFFSWTSTQFGDLKADFWNLSKEEGRVLPDMYGPSVHSGPVYAEMDIYNKGVIDGKVYFKEINAVRTYALPHDDFWLFDFYVRHVPVDPEAKETWPQELLLTGATPKAMKEADVPTNENISMTLPQYRYGGMAFRGMGDWLEGELGIVTSEEHGRVDGNAQPARWVDFTGPLGNDWGGVTLFDNPLNQRYPTPARIHPKLPYFCFAWTQDAPYTVKGNQSLDLLYRVAVHNGKPNKAINERIARDFVNPPDVRWTPRMP